EWQRLIEIRMDVLARLGDGGRFAAFFDDRQRLSMIAELFGKTLQQRDHALVTLRFDGSRFQIGFAQRVHFILGKRLAAYHAHDLVEIVFRWSLVENLSGLEIANDRSS